MSVSAATLLLPAPDTSWRVWKSRAASPADAVDTPASFTDRSKPIVIGLPASACRSLGLILPQSEPSVLEQMVAAQLEKRGFRVHYDENKNFRWHHLGNSGPHAIISVDILADPFPDVLAVSHAADYTAALRLAQLPLNHLVVIEEQGDLVMAVGHQGKLYHSHIFGQLPASTEDLAKELIITQTSLEAQAGFSAVTGVTLVGNWEAREREALRAAVGLPVEIASQLPPSRAIDTHGWTALLPSAVREAQNSSSRKKKFVRGAIMLGALYVALTFLGFAYLRFLQQTAERLAAEVETSSPTATSVRKTAEHWKALAPALEEKRFPLLLLSDITALMPPSGIVLRDFDAKPNELDIRGDARDAQLAFQFLEDLKKHRNLGRYTWSMPQPTVKEKTASFRATGKLTP